MPRHHGETSPLDEIRHRLDQLVDRRTRMGLTGEERQEFDCLIAQEAERLRQRGDL